MSGRQFMSVHMLQVDSLMLSIFFSKPIIPCTVTMLLQIHLEMQRSFSLQQENLVTTRKGLAMKARTLELLVLSISRFHLVKLMGFFMVILSSFSHQSFYWESLTLYIWQVQEIWPGFVHWSSRMFYIWNQGFFMQSWWLAI